MSAVLDLPQVESEKKSTHKAEVVEVNLTRHENADSLSVCPVYGYNCVVKTADWAGIKKAIYVVPDSTVDVRRPEFSFLADQAKADGRARVKAKKLRGIVSYGLLVPAPDDAVVGEDWAERLDIQHYEPKSAGDSDRGGLFMGGEVASGPNLVTVKYDLDAGRRYGKQVFESGEPVICSEKIHGCHAKYVYHDGRMHCSSRTEWKKEYADYSHVTVESLQDKVGVDRAKEIVARLQEQSKNPRQNLWWQALDATPTLRKFCESHPDIIVHGECFGAVQDLPYGRKKGEVSFVAFDMMRAGRWLDFEEAYALATDNGVPWVPILARVPFDFDEVCELAEGKSLIEGANHIREGTVCRPLKERYHPRIGRVCLKWVSGSYLERSKD